MKKLGLVFFILFVAVSATAQQKQWTLKQCVEYALDNNISVKQSELDVTATDIEKLTAIGAFLPSLNANGNVSENTGLSFDPTTGNAASATFLSASGGVNVGYTLFDGLRNFRQVQRAELSKLASQYRLSKMKDDISLLVANTYLQVLLNKANKAAVIAQNDVTKEQLKRTQELVDAGVLPRGDLLEIKATNASDKQRIAVAENSVRISLISLAQLLLVKDYENFDIVDEDYQIVNDEIILKPVEEIIEGAKENRSEVKIAQQNVALAEKDVQIAKGAFLPTLSAFFGYDTRFSEAQTDPFTGSTVPFGEQLYLNDGLGYGLRLSIPILNGFQTKANVQRNKINLDRSRFQLEQAELDLESNIYQAYVDAEGTKKAYDAAVASLESQELAYQYAKDRYDAGNTNAFDFNQSKLRFDNAKIEVNRTKYDYIFKVKVLELYFGIPATELKF
jgi:outer membrane protein